MNYELNRVCKRCGEEKPLEDFPLFSTKGAGRKKTCNACQNKQLKIRKKLLIENPKPSDGTMCAVPNCTNTNLVLDHCHQTGKFRGWICAECNAGIGKLGDNIQGVINAFNYLSPQPKNLNLSNQPT